MNEWEEQNSLELQNAMTERDNIGTPPSPQKGVTSKLVHIAHRRHNATHTLLSVALTLELYGTHMLAPRAPYQPGVVAGRPRLAARRLPPHVVPEPLRDHLPPKVSRAS